MSSPGAGDAVAEQMEAVSMSCWHHCTQMPFSIPPCSARRAPALRQPLPRPAAHGPTAETKLLSLCRFFSTQSISSLLPSQCLPAASSPALSDTRADSFNKGECLMNKPLNICAHCHELSIIQPGSAGKVKASLAAVSWALPVSAKAAWGTGAGWRAWAEPAGDPPPPH